MTATNHTALVTGFAANAALVEAPLAQLDAAIGDLTTLGTTPKTSVAGAVGTSTPTTTAKTLSGAINELDADVGDKTTLGTTVQTSLVAAIGLVALTTAVKTTVIAAINELVTSIGALASLGTTTKTSTVAAINELVASIAALAGGATVSDARLKEWAEGECYEATALTYSGTYVNTVASAVVKWPDGSAGAFTSTTINPTWETIDAYTITHTTAGKTVTQAAITRDGEGRPTVKPVLSVA